MAQTTKNHARVCLWDRVDIFSIIEIKSKKNYFGGLNGYFQAKPSDENLICK